MRFGYTILYVGDPERSVAFYERAFGLARRLLHESGDWAELETGATTLAFASQQLAAHTLPRSVMHGSGEDGAPAFEVCLVTDDVEGAFERAVQAGAEPVTAPRRKRWGDVAFVRDLDGVLVQLASPMRLP